MDIVTMVIGLLGGLALFLYGMQMMSNGLEKAAGNQMKSILEKVVSNRFLGVAVGAGITAAIQSSSATTVMVVGFVNTGLMTIKQAVWIIMGANIGTTITGQLITLDIGALAKIIAFLGVAAVVFVKKPKIQYFGSILAGFGILFIGMDLMSAAMTPIKDNPDAFVGFMTAFQNPLMGIIIGAGFTALIQSSAASIGILQTIAAQGLIPFSSSVYIIFGQNIGTCITAVLASIGTTRNAKRTTVIHLAFNIIGTAIFSILFLTFPQISSLIESLTPNNPVAQIANMHTLFNIATTLILFPFGGLLAKLAEVILPERKGENKLTGIAALNNEYTRGNLRLGFSAVHTDILAKEIENMISLAKENVERCFNAVIKNDPSIFKSSAEVEEKLDLLNKEVSNYVSKTLIYNKSGEGVASTEQYFLISGNAERIGDHAYNIGGYSEVMKKHKVNFSSTAINELEEMKKVCITVLDELFSPSKGSENWLSGVADLEQLIDDMTKKYRDKHLKRMSNGECSEEACMLYSELLTDFERIGDHALNIAQAYSKIN